MTNAMFERTYQIDGVGFGELDLSSVEKFPDGEGNGRHADHVTIGNLNADLQKIFGAKIGDTVTITITRGIAGSDIDPVMPYFGNKTGAESAIESATMAANRYIRGRNI